MNVPLRITLNDEQKQRYKDVFGEYATRVNIKVRVATLFFKAMGDDTPFKSALKSVKLSDNERSKVKRPIDDDGEEDRPKKKRFVLKG